MNDSSDSSETVGIPLVLTAILGLFKWMGVPIPLWGVFLPVLIPLGFLTVACAIALIARIILSKRAIPILLTILIALIVVFKIA